MGVSLSRVRAPRGIPSGMAMPKQLALFAETNAESARPAAAWLKQKRVDSPWSIDATVALAKQLLALRETGLAVGVSPLCRPDADATASSTEDFAALQAALEVISLVSTVSSLVAWVRATFLAIALALWLSTPWSTRTWSCLFPQSWHSCASRMASLKPTSMCSWRLCATWTGSSLCSGSYSGR